MAVATVDVKDVIGEHLAKILASSTARRHADLIDATKALVAALDAGDFVAPVKAATTPARRSLERARTPDASSEPPCDAAPPAAPASPPPPPSPRASLVSGLSDDRVDALLVVFRLAFDSKSPKIVDAALAALAKLIARGLVRGEADLPAPSAGAGAGERTPTSLTPETSVGANLADAAGEDDRSASASASDPSASDPSASDSPTRRPPLTPPPTDDDGSRLSTPGGDARLTAAAAAAAAARSVRSRADANAGELVDLACGASEMLDEGTELRVLECLLTAVSSSKLRVRGRALLRCVRTCYNIFLGSKSEVNQTTARATLTQMLAATFHRLEVNDAEAVAPAVVVADALRGMGATPTGRAPPIPTPEEEEDVTTQVSSFVQGFIDRVSSDMNAVAVAVGAAEEDLAEGKRTRTQPETVGVTRSEFDEDVENRPANEETPHRPENDSGAPRPENDPLADAPEARSETRARESDLETDAFLVFRALCKLAKKPGDLQNVAVVRGKALSLELLKLVLDSAGPRFHASARFRSAVSEYLCDAVMSNATPATPSVYALACGVFLALLKKFRSALKAEIGVFFPTLVLKPLEVLNPKVPLAPYPQRRVLMALVRELCGDAEVLVDVFVNFDCDLDSSNLYERLVNALVRVAQGLPGIHDLTGTEAAREAVLKAEALECLSDSLGALGDWVDRRLLRPLPGDDAEERGGRVPREGDARRVPTGPDGDAGGTPGDRAPGGALVSRASSRGIDVAGVELKRASKLEYQEAVALFNKKAKKGVAALQKIGRLGREPAEIAAFLRSAPGLDKGVVGDYLGERDDLNVAVMHAYAESMDFAGLALDEAIRAFLAGFRLPGEAQKIDRLMEKFAELYCRQNPGAYKSADTAYVLSFSVIMLNTDAHNPMVKNKMTKEGFLRNNRGVDDGEDLPKAHLEDLYDRIVKNEIRMKDEDPDELAKKNALNEQLKPGDVSASINRAMKDMSNRLGVDVLMSLMVGKTKADQMIDTSGFMEEVRARRGARDAGNAFHATSDPACARPMLEVAWPAMLAVFSMSFEATEASSVVRTSLEGFERAVHLAAAVGVDAVRDAFVLSLANLTSLHSPSNMRSKNIAAMRALVGVGVREGNALGNAWRHVLRAVSRYDHLYSLATGYDDASLFEVEGSPNGGGPAGGPERGAPPSTRSGPPVSSGSSLFGGPSYAAPAFSSDVSMMPSMPTMQSVFGTASVASVFGGGDDDDPFAHLRKKPASDAGGGGAAPEKKKEEASSQPAAPPSQQQAALPSPRESPAAPAPPASSPSASSVDKTSLHDLDVVPPPLHVLKELSPDELADGLFHVSDRLDGEAVVAFVRCLCEASLEEISSRWRPRVYSLAKLVETAHLNMDRIRLVWSRMWSALGDFFVEAGCNPNLQVAMYAVDSLRQLAMKFLERGELANYSFQNDFLRPFAVVIRRARATEIRELVIRCMSQMVAGRSVRNVKSGWKSMFAVFRVAASDGDPRVVRLAFETIESIIREHFDFITETDATVFTDCVACLVKFAEVKTPDPEKDDGVVSLNAIAFLRFCALKLADGALGDLEETVEPGGTNPEDRRERGSTTTDVSELSENETVAPPRSKKRGATAFTDAESHVRFWFPLLKGLSSLTFDPRLEIRRSALEVLFDVLKFHGDVFSPGFWAKTYDDVLFPIFDRVAVVGKDDPSEADADDAWVYQTTQHCLELVVDLTVRFYRRACLRVADSPEEKASSSSEGSAEDALGPVLPRLLDVFVALASAPRAELGQCGVGALSRLLLGAGHLFDDAAWGAATDAVARLAAATAPDAAGLIAAEEKAAEEEEEATKANRSGSEAGTAGTEGGAAVAAAVAARDAKRREVAAHASTQRLLVQATAEVYFRHGARLGERSVEAACATLEDVAGGAAVAGAALERREAKAAARRRESEKTRAAGGDERDATAMTASTPWTPSTPARCLLEVEVEASRAALAVLLHLHTAGASPDESPRKAELRSAEEAPIGGGGGGGGGDLRASPSSALGSSLDRQTAAQARVAAASEPRLVALIRSVLTGFAAACDAEATGAKAREGGGRVLVRREDSEVATRAPLATDALVALARTSDASFRGNLEGTYPALVALVEKDGTPAEVARALGDVFAKRVGPLVVDALARE